ncbi:unnamed protein product, partial [Polarella glacialis]
LQQEYSRRSEVSLADVHIQNHVMLDLKLEETTEIPDDGCLVRGLFLEGCAWNKTESCLELVERAATSMMSPLPLVGRTANTHHHHGNMGEEEKVICTLLHSTRRHAEDLLLSCLPSSFRRANLRRFGCWLG